MRVRGERKGGEDGVREKGEESDKHKWGRYVGRWMRMLTADIGSKGGICCVA